MTTLFLLMTNCTIIQSSSLTALYVVPWSFDQSPEVMAWRTNYRVGSRSDSLINWRGANAAGMASATMVRAYSSVCLMAASGELSTGDLLNASAVFSLPGMCLMPYLNCLMYNIHLSILPEDGFECGPSTVISGLWSVQFSKSFPWMYRKEEELAYGSHSAQVRTGHLLASVPRELQYLLERHLW